MSSSKVVRLCELSDDWKVSWKVHTSSRSPWHLKSHHNERCRACNKTKPYVFNFLWRNDVYCLECLEFIFYMTVPNPIVLENHLKQIQSNLLTFKKEKQELKKSIENEKIQDRKNYYVLKSQLNLLKSKQTELKEKENSIQKQLSELLEQETTTLEKLPNKECYRFVQREENKYYRWSIDSFVHLSELCSRVGGTCLKCNLSSQTVIFIQNHESECSFCLQCIRSFFNEMKLTKEECEGEIQKLHECVAKEKEKHENIMKNFKEKQMILEQMMKSQ